LDNIGQLKLAEGMCAHKAPLDYYFVSREPGKGQRFERGMSVSPEIEGGGGYLCGWGAQWRRACFQASPAKPEMNSQSEAGSGTSVVVNDRLLIVVRSLLPL
jgi:hypothetical protein